MEVLTPRMARTASLMISTSFSSAAKSQSARYSGQEEIIMDSSSSCRLQKISSVMKGIKGCSSFKDWISTVFRVQMAAAVVESPSPHSLGFTISMYQSQNSSQIKSYTFWRAIPSSYLSMFSVTSFARRFTFDRIHRSAMVRSDSSTFSSEAFPMFIMINRLAFHTLLAKLRLASTLSQ